MDENVPIIAPTKTSDGKCTPSHIRDNPTNEAQVNAGIITFHLGTTNNSATAKANASAV